MKYISALRYIRGSRLYKVIGHLLLKALLWSMALLAITFPLSYWSNGASGGAWFILYLGIGVYYFLWSFKIITWNEILIFNSSYQFSIFWLLLAYVTLQIEPVFAALMKHSLDPIFYFFWNFFGFSAA